MLRISGSQGCVGSWKSNLTGRNWHIQTVDIPNMLGVVHQDQEQWKIVALHSTTTCQPFQDHRPNSIPILWSVLVYFVITCDMLAHLWLNRMPQGLHRMIKWTFWGELCRAPGVPTEAKRIQVAASLLRQRWPQERWENSRSARAAVQCRSVVFSFHFFSMKLFQCASRWFGPNNWISLVDPHMQPRSQYGWAFFPTAYRPLRPYVRSSNNLGRKWHRCNQCFR